MELIGWIFSLMNTVIYVIGIIPFLLAVIAIFISMTFMRKKPKSRGLQQEDWKPDVVYLCQFPLVPKVRSISPFALKLETWLKINNIKYVNISTMQFSKKGQIPYVELNGEQIPDSNIIIERLAKHFSKDITYGYDQEILGKGYMAMSVLENHLAETGFYYRYGLKMREFIKVLQIEKQFPKGIKFWSFAQPYISKLRSHMSGLSRHSYEEIWEFARKDLRALSAAMGKNPYFLGENISTVDCAIFGHLAQILYIPLDFPFKDCLLEECENLVNLVEKIKREHWSEWLEDDE